MIPGILIEKAVKLLASQFKLDKILKYVEEPNDADERIDNLEVDLAQSILVMSRINESIEDLKCDTHPPREFIVCKKCNQTIKEK